MLVLFKIPAYFGDGNKIRRATQSPPFQGRSFPRKAKSCCCVSFPPCPQARSILPQRNPGPCGGGTAYRTMRGQVWAETPLVHNHLVLRKKTGTGKMQKQGSQASPHVERKVCKLKLRIKEMAFISQSTRTNQALLWRWQTRSWLLCPKSPTA